MMMMMMMMMMMINILVFQTELCGGGDGSYFHRSRRFGENRKLQVQG
jgi:hypothetical protein